MWPLLTGGGNLRISLRVFTVKFPSLVGGLFLESPGGNLPIWNALLRNTVCFQLVNRTKPCELMLTEKSLCPCFPVSVPPPPFPPRLCSDPEPGRQLFSPTHWRRGWILNWRYLAACQNNSKLHTCRLLASTDGKMTNVVFLAFSSWQAHQQLGSLLSLSVHKGLGFSLEAPRELSSFTTASNKQFPLEKVDFLARHGLWPPLHPLSHTGPLAVPWALI